MSDKTAPVIDLKPEDDSTEPKQSFVQKTKTFVKTHKKPTIAVAALAGLVAVSAVTGRRTVQATVQSPLELEIVDEPADDQSA